MPSPTDPPQPETRTKVCRICQEEKPLTAFYRKPSAADGHETRCGKCFTAYMKEYWRRNPHKRQEQTRNYQAKNREALNQKSYERYWRNPEKSRADALRRYYEKRAREKKDE